MSLYGDKLTPSSGSGKNDLALVPGSGRDSLLEFTPIEEVSNGFDWVDTNTDGLADDWTEDEGTASIITDQLGFSGRAQKCAADLDPPAAELSQALAPAGLEVWYRLSFKWYLYLDTLALQSFKVYAGATELGTMTGVETLKTKEIDFFVEGGIGFDLTFVIENAGGQDYFVIDEVSLKLLQTDKLTVS